jgi:hypothetical protein
MVENNNRNRGIHHENFSKEYNPYKILNQGMGKKDILEKFWNFEF